MNRSDNQNMENMLTSGWYQGNYWTGIPSGANNTACTAYVYEAFPIELIHQLFIDSSGKHYFRTRFGSVWTNWSEFSTDIPTFYKDYANLSALASALGVDDLGAFKDNSLYPSTNTMDNIVQNGLYDVTSIPDNPFGNGMTALCFVVRNENYVMQRTYRAFVPTKVRWLWSDGWTQWADD